MTDWRSEPPDSAGWWLWRPETGKQPKLYSIAIGTDAYGRAIRTYMHCITASGDISPNGWRCLHSDGGQWLKVPE